MGTLTNGMTDALEFKSTWSLGEEAYQSILRDLRSIGAARIVEFGSGTSTLRLSRDLPNAELFCVESDAAYLDETRRNLEAYGGLAEVDVSLRPVAWQRYGLSWFRSYGRGPFPDGVDAVLIDGPPIQTRRGREACLYQVFPHCHAGTRIYLDDYRRDAERQIVDNWLRAYPGALSHIATFDVDYQVAVLERTVERSTRREHWKNTADSLVQSAKLLLRP